MLSYKPSGNLSGNLPAIIVGSTLGGLVAVLAVALLLVLIMYFWMNIRESRSTADPDKKFEAYVIPTSLNDAYSQSFPNASFETTPGCYITPYSTVQRSQEPTYARVDDSTVQSSQDPVYARVDDSTTPSPACAEDDDSDGGYVINQLVYDEAKLPQST